MAYDANSDCDYVYDYVYDVIRHSMTAIRHAVTTFGSSDKTGIIV